ACSAAAFTFGSGSLILSALAAMTARTRNVPVKEGSSDSPFGLRRSPRIEIALKSLATSVLLNLSLNLVLNASLVFRRSLQNFDCTSAGFSSSAGGHVDAASERPINALSSDRSEAKALTEIGPEVSMGGAIFPGSVVVATNSTRNDSISRLPVIWESVTV